MRLGVLHRSRCPQSWHTTNMVCSLRTLLCLTENLWCFFPVSFQLSFWKRGTLQSQAMLCLHPLAAAFLITRFWWWYLLINLWESPCQPPSLRCDFGRENTLCFHLQRVFLPSKGIFLQDTSSAFWGRMGEKEH